MSRQKLIATPIQDVIDVADLFKRLFPDGQIKDPLSTRRKKVVVGYFQNILVRCECEPSTNQVFFQLKCFGADDFTQKLAKERLRSFFKSLNEEFNSKHIHIEPSESMYGLSFFFYKKETRHSEHATKTCDVCGKTITSGFLFDGVTCICSKECATKFFDNDEGCVDILIDEGDRLVWHNAF